MPHKISLAWLFPPKKHWSGIKDLTLGVIAKDLEKLDQSERDIVARFGKNIAAAGGEQYDKIIPKGESGPAIPWIIGSRFDASSIGEAGGLIVAAIRGLKKDLSENADKSR